MVDVFRKAGSTVQSRRLRSAWVPANAKRRENPEGSSLEVLRDDASDGRDLDGLAERYSLA